MKSTSRYHFRGESYLIFVYIVQIKSARSWFFNPLCRDNSAKCDYMGISVPPKRVTRKRQPGSRLSGTTRLLCNRNVEIIGNNNRKRATRQSESTRLAGTTRPCNRQLRMHYGQKLRVYKHSSIY